MTVASCRDMRVESWGRIRVVSFPSEMWREESTLTRTGTARCQLKLRLTGHVIDATFAVAISIRSRCPIDLGHSSGPLIRYVFFHFFHALGSVCRPHTPMPTSQCRCRQRLNSREQVQRRRQQQQHGNGGHGTSSIRRVLRTQL